MHSQTQAEREVTAQATDWLERLDQLTSAERIELAEWLKSSPIHVREFLVVKSMMVEIEDADLSHIDLTQDLTQMSPGVVSFGNALRKAADPRHRTPRHRLKWYALAAGMIGLAVTGAWTFMTYPQWHGYSTKIGEIRTFELRDGSVIHLNTQSRVKIQYSKTGRDLQLLAGEALFKVAREPGRPFRVHAGAATFQALGTQFNVYRHSDSTTVSVLEGVVGVSTDGRPPEDLGSNSIQSSNAHSNTSNTKIRAGQEVEVTREGQIAQIAETNAAQVGLWRQRRLVFRNDTLTSVATEFNRFNRQPQIQVEGQLASTTRLSGIYDADDPESLLLFLSELQNVAVERSGNVIRIYGRTED